jgi:hypothetical protein
MSPDGKQPHGILIFMLFATIILVAIGGFAVYLQYVDKNIALEQQISNLQLFHQPETLTKPFRNQTIALVTTNATNIFSGNFYKGSALFPGGLFSQNDSEWGLVNLNDDSVTLSIYFKQPTQVKSVSNIFTDCNKINCYNWTAYGVNEDNTLLQLIPPTQASENTPSKRVIQSNIKLKELHVTVARMEGIEKHIYWKKIQLEY